MKIQEIQRDPRNATATTGAYHRITLLVLQGSDHNVGDANDVLLSLGHTPSLCEYGRGPSPHQVF